ncbi:TIR domain-containing protein [Kribbella sp. CA-253562]|uniref:TIR domain-containing protein n=1 Tax=Kribbella sp. CA-253562 TaxID=3239942 RepID=UPI003D89E0B7
MARRTFFSFEYGDVSRAMVVRNSWVTQERIARGFIDAAELEKLKRVGDDAVKRWINSQMDNTTVTVVLVGGSTCQSRWVKYEIDRSKALGHGLIGINISEIKDLFGKTSSLCGKIPAGYSFYNWFGDSGYRNMGTWIEQAAIAAGK